MIMYINMFTILYYPIHRILGHPPLVNIEVMVNRPRAPRCSIQGVIQLSRFSVGPAILNGLV